jgi:hypothetical protein
VDAQLDDCKGKTGSVRSNITTDKENQGNGKGIAGWNPIVKDVADDYAEDGVTTYMVCRQIML